VQQDYFIGFLDVFRISVIPLFYPVRVRFTLFMINHFFHIQISNFALNIDHHQLNAICMDITLNPIATITNKRDTPTDDFWGDTISEITLLPHIPEEAFKGIEDFSHLEIIYFFDQVDQNKIVLSGRPRGNSAWPEMGIFCQRKKDRPNHLGLCTVELIEHTGRSIKVKYLDAID
jgi:tRNA-Thr(GGU) m(6)t(6)A37 methyltransferase TsaA